jgi:hypothetical protein
VIKPNIIETIGIPSAGGGGIGDMTKLVYDPANKTEQVLTISDLAAISEVVVSTEATLQDYIDNEWVDGSIGVGDKVIINAGASPIEAWMLKINNGSVVSDYIHLTTDAAAEVAYDETLVPSGLTSTNLQDAVDEIQTNNPGIQFDITNTDVPVEGQVNWNSDDKTLQIGLNGGNVALQLGQEEMIRATAMEDISNGEVVYVSGATGNNIEVSFANNTDFTTACKTIAVATEDVLTSQKGYFTSFGFVRDIDTSGFSEGDELYLGTSGSITNIMPTAGACIVRIGYCTRSSATEGSIYVNISVLTSKTISELTGEPTGFSDPSAVIINGDSTTRTVTLTGTWTAHYKGVKNNTIVSGWTSPAHGTDTTTQYFLNYNGTDIEWTDVASLDATFFQNLLIAFAFYDSINSNWVYLREPHGFMPWQSHRGDHYNIGTYKLTGGTLSGFVLNSVTAADRRPDVSGCVVYDEDIPTTILGLAAGTYTLYGILGTDADASFLVGANDIVRLSGNRPFWNEFTGGSWTQTLIGNNEYMNVWLIAIPVTADASSQAYRYVWQQGQFASSVLSDVQSRSVFDLSQGELEVLTPESVYIARVIIRYLGGNWDIVQVDNLTGSRVSQATSPSGVFLSSVASDTSLTGLGTTDSPLGLSGTFTPASDSTTAFQFFKADGTTSVLTIDTTNDSVGIGTDSPTGNEVLYIANDTKNRKIAIKSSTALGGGYIDFYNNLNSSKGYIGYPSSNTNDNMAIWNRSDADILFGTNNTQKMVLRSDGLLYVEGAIESNGGSIQSNGVQSTRAPKITLYRPLEDFGDITYGTDSSPTETFYFKNRNAGTDAGIYAGSLNTGSSSPGVGVYGALIRNGSSNASTLLSVDTTSAVAPYKIIHFYGTQGQCLIRGDGDVENTNNSYGGISDIRLKENVEPARNYLDDLMKLELKTFNFIGKNTKNLGLIAQDVEKIFPKIVKTAEGFDGYYDKDGNKITDHKTIIYSVIPLMNLSAIQELKKENDDLKQTISLLRQEIIEINQALGFETNKELMT